MSWITDDGHHEGWVARVLDDGRQAHGSTGRRREDGSIEMLELVPVDDDPEGEELVSSDRVRRWVPQCTCGWRGTTWERVTELHLADDATWRGWRPLGDVGDEPQHIEEFAHAEWRRHLQPHDAAAAVSRAAEAVAAHQRGLDEAVLDARRRGLSWSAVGAAAGMTKQAAHERWSGASQDAPAESRPPEPLGGGWDGLGWLTPWHTATPDDRTPVLLSPDELALLRELLAAEYERLADAAPQDARGNRRAAVMNLDADLEYAAIEPDEADERLSREATWHPANQRSRMLPVVLKLYSRWSGGKSFVTNAIRYAAAIEYDRDGWDGVREVAAAARRAADRSGG